MSRLPRNKLNIVKILRSPKVSLDKPQSRTFSEFTSRKKRAFPDVLIGILSYNRWKCLDRLLHSLDKPYHRPISIIVSDDFSDDKQTVEYLNSMNVCVLKNKSRLGVAGNTNRILKASERFKHLFILNDDVEVKSLAFIDEFIDLKYPHVCGHTPNIYGSKPISKLSFVHERMQGSILYVDTSIIKDVGYFDTAFGYYGMEHIDWSKRVVKRYGLQGVPTIQSNNIVTHDAKSAVEDRKRLLSISKELIGRVSSSRFVDSDVVIPQITVKANQEHHDYVLAMDYPSIKVSDHNYDVEMHGFFPTDDTFLLNKIKDSKVFSPICKHRVSGNFVGFYDISSVGNTITFGNGQSTIQTSVMFSK